MHDVTIEFPVHFTRGAAGRKEVNVGVEPAASPVEAGRVPRVARLMALAIRFKELVRMGEVESMPIWPASAKSRGLGSARSWTCCA